MNYQEKNIEGNVTTYRRTHTITILNPHNQIPSIQFNEEDLTILPDGRTTVTDNTSCGCKFDDPTRIINAVNRETGEVVGQFPIGLLDALITGLYLEEATRRDTPVEPVIEPYVE